MTGGEDERTVADAAASNTPCKPLEGPLNGSTVPGEPRGPAGALGLLGGFYRVARQTLL